MSFRNHISFHCFAFLLTILGIQNTALANPIPTPLQDWVPWVKSQIQSIDCPQFENTPLCVWHGQLEIATDSKGANFTMIVSLDEESEIEIIGNNYCESSC